MLAKYGREHMADLGRKGFQSFCERYFSGSREDATEWLHRRAASRQADSHAQRILAEREAAGEKVSSIELPIYEEPGEVPF